MHVGARKRRKQKPRIKPELVGDFGELGAFGSVGAVDERTHGLQKVRRAILLRHEQLEALVHQLAHQRQDFIGLFAIIDQNNGERQSETVGR